MGGLRAGSSREVTIQSPAFNELNNAPCEQVFRTQQATSPELHQHAERFFNPTPPTTQLAAPQPFNLSALHDVLPQVQVSVQSPQTQGLFPSGWASDFLSQHVQEPAPAIKHVEAQQGRMQTPVSSPGLQSACALGGFNEACAELKGC